MTALSEEPAAQPPTATRTRNEQFGIREGACTAVMQGAGENYFTAFALMLQATTSQVGLLGHFRPSLEPLPSWDP